MTSYPRGYRPAGPAGRATDARRGWLAPLVMALVVVGVLLGEVWQSSRVAELSLRLDKTRVACDAARARLESLRAELDRHATRKALDPLAGQLGLKPAEPQQVVLLPADYLARREAPPRNDSPALAYLYERIARVLVPDAWARAREGR